MHVRGNRHFCHWNLVRVFRWGSSFPSCAQYTSTVSMGTDHKIAQLHWNCMWAERKNFKKLTSGIIYPLLDLDEESLLGQWFQDTLSSMPVVTTPSPQVPSRKKSESGDVGDSGTESTPSGRSFQMAPEEVSKHILITLTLHSLFALLLTTTFMRYM